jgi:hypothetical protein
MLPLPLPPTFDQLVATAILPGVVRIDLYGEIHGERACALINKAQLIQMIKELTAVALKC